MDSSLDESLEQEKDEENNSSETTPKSTRGGTIRRCQYEVFVEYLKTGIRPSKEKLKEVDLLDFPSSSKHGYGMTGRFTAWAKKMALAPGDNNNALVLKKTGKEILCREDFESAVRRINTSITGTHHSFVVTLKKIREIYTMGKRQFGMSEEFVREVLLTCIDENCHCKKVKKLLQEKISQTSLRASKSCSSLPRKRRLSCSNLLAKKDADSVPSNEKKLAASTDTDKPKPPVTYYALLDLASIRSAHFAGRQIDMNLGKTPVTTTNLNSNSEALIGQPRPVILPRQSSVQSKPSLPQAHLSQGKQRPVVFKLYSSNPAVSSSIAKQLVGLNSDGERSQLSKTHSTNVKAGESRPSCNPAELIDLDSLTSLSMYAESPKVTVGPGNSLNKEENQPTQTEGKTIHSFSSFNLQCEGILPYSDLWYYQKDIFGETNRYKKLVSVIEDMRIDFKHAIIGSKLAAERLRKKMTIAESLVIMCKDVIISRKRQITEKKRNSQDTTLQSTDVKQAVHIDLT